MFLAPSSVPPAELFCNFGGDPAFARDRALLAFSEDFRRRSLEERIPWKCETEAKRRKVEVLMLPTPRAICVPKEKAKATNAFRT
jgi:hypothetical protein